MPWEPSREVCESCGFDSDLYNRADTISSQWVIPKVLAAAVDGLGRSVTATRPDASTWSIAEYVDHVREVVFGNRLAIEVARNEPGRDLGEPPETGITTEQKPVDVAAALDGVASEYTSMEELLGGLTDEQWANSVTLSGQLLSIDWLARHVLHDGLHHLADIGQIRQRLGHGAQPRTGSVEAIHVSSGGVPKNPVSSARVSGAGVEGDAQADRVHHGRPVQAVCLWGTDVIDALRAEGHPIQAGNAGENITIGGLVWSELGPGDRIKVGEVPMLISAHAIPCAKNARWFKDRDFNRIGHQAHPGFSRLYAIPLTAATIAVNDPVTVGGS